MSEPDLQTKKTLQELGFIPKDTPEAKEWLRENTDKLRAEVERLDQELKLREQVTLPTLLEFLENFQARPFEAWIKHPEFAGLKLRKGRATYNLGEELFHVDELITVIDIIAKLPRDGAFTRLIDYLWEKYPASPILVENVEEEWFVEKLFNKGFEECSIPNCFVFHPRIVGIFSVERLLHLRCGNCNGWWTIGDGDPRGKYHCPHCGTLQERLREAPPLPRFDSGTQRHDMPKV